MGAKAIGPATSIVLAAIILTGCGMNSPMGGDPNAPAFAQVEENARSQTIENLMARPSVIQPGSPFDAVAKAVLATHARTAEAELRSARLRARAASKNWLPRIGPNISLTSMSELVVTPNGNSRMTNVLLSAFSMRPRTRTLPPRNPSL